jgi:hypothetical protein
VELPEGHRRADALPNAQMAVISASAVKARTACERERARG